MSKPRKIQLSPGLSLIAGTIVQPERPTSESIKEQIFGAILDYGDECSPNADVVKGLVAAYSALLEAEDEEEVGFDRISDNEAELLYREYAIKGRRNAIRSKHPKVAKKREDCSVYEYCDWYDFGRMTWPTQLIAEVGFIVGSKAGKETLAWDRYHTEQESAS
jgi:hypothetical protein